MTSISTACLFQPLRAVIVGPPASGKSTVAKQLCEHYKLHHIQIKKVIDDEIEILVSMLILVYSDTCTSITLVWYSSKYIYCLVYSGNIVSGK